MPPSRSEKLFNFANHTQQMFNKASPEWTCDFLIVTPNTLSKASPGWTRDFQLEAGRWWSWYPEMPSLALGSCSSLALHSSERGGISRRDPHGWGQGVPLKKPTGNDLETVNNFFLPGMLSAIIEESLIRQFPSFWQHPRSPQMVQVEESDWMLWLLFSFVYVARASIELLISLPQPGDKNIASCNYYF